MGPLYRHHAEELPEKSYGVNFGLTLSIWDYLFGFAHVPVESSDVKLGFPDLEKFDTTKKKNSRFLRKKK